MSDTVRTYTPARRTASSNRRRRASRGCAIPLALLIPIAALCAVYALWITRDSTELAAHLPKDHRLRIAASDVIAHREEIAASGIWQALPFEGEFAQIPALLTRDVHVPDWVLNNIIGPQCFVSGDSIGDGHDLLFVTKMHRLGVLIERGFRWVGDVDRERAGGLHLRHLNQPDLYYAVRGRVLIVSPSRRTLIHALTLDETEALVTEDVERVAVDLANRQVGGIVHFREGDTLARHLAFLRFGIRFDAEEAHAKFEARLANLWDSEALHLLQGVTPQTLHAPVDGMAVFSAHFGKPLAEVWQGIGALTGLPLFAPTQWSEWTYLADGETPGLAYTLTRVLGKAGPGFECTWSGIDPYEMIPVPQILVTAEVDARLSDELAEAFPTLPTDVPEYAPYPRRDPETGTITYPIFGGPSLQPTAVLRETSIIVASNRTVAEGYAGAPLRREPLPLPGNLYLRIRPLECVNAVAELGQQLVDVGALKGYTPESYRDTVIQWRRNAERIEECSALFSHDSGQIQGEIRIVSKAASSDAGQTP